MLDFTNPIGHNLISVLVLTNALGLNLISVLGLTNPLGHRLISALVLTGYGTARYKLEGKLRVVICTHVMYVISLVLSSVSTRKFVCSKILVGRFCVKKCVPTKALCVCLSEYSKTIWHESTYTHNFPCRLREKYPITCNKALIQMYTHNFFSTAPVLNKEQ